MLKWLQQNFTGTVLFAQSFFKPESLYRPKLPRAYFGKDVMVGLSLLGIQGATQCRKALMQMNLQLHHV